MRKPDAVVDAAREFLDTPAEDVPACDLVSGMSCEERPCSHDLASFARAQRLALLQSLLDEELNTHGGKSSAVGTWLRKRMEEERQCR